MIIAVKVNAHQKKGVNDMLELNREDIIKALECCIEVNCGSIAICPYREKFKNCYECQANLKKEALTLIKQLTEEKDKVVREILALVWDAYNTTYYDAEFEERLDKIEEKYIGEKGE
jgi:hypothetical protein